MKDESQLETCILEYLNDEELRYSHGQNGVEWAQLFTNNRIWEGLDKLYKN